MGVQASSRCSQRLRHKLRNLEPCHQHSFMMMIHPKNIHGLRVPLFDRLVDGAPEVQKEPTSLRVQGCEALFASIARDLQRLLNTRRASDAPLDPAKATVLDYGIPHF